MEPVTIEFRLPDLGEDVTGGEVVNVLVKEGDAVEKEQALLELETDKALLEVPSPAKGKIVKIHTSAGAKLNVGEMIVTLEESGEAEGDEPGETKETESPKQKDGAPKESAEPEKKPKAETEKKEAAKPESAKKKVPEPEEAEDGEDESADEEEAEEETEEVDAPRAEVVEVSGDAPRAPAAPSVRRLARELGVALEKVKGSGAGGRITREDVLEFTRSRTGSQPGKSARVEPAAATELPDFSRWGEIERVALSNVRKRTVEQLSRSWREIPHVTQVEEADITDLESLRRRHAERAAAKGGNLTVTVFVLKAVVAALKEFPDLNASLDLAAEELVRKRYFHIGVAVDTEHGLLVPVLRDVDRKPLLDLSAELLTMSERARNRKVKLEELKGATFTVTNLGGIGGTAFTPIINPPEVGILGLARTQKRLRLDDDEIIERLMLPLCLSYDHRVIDGAYAIRFLRKVASMLEDPGLLLLEP
jgi:pyruvate dehydrogenase E2 component (dihydrolipoamide acetyltransferase)